MLRCHFARSFLSEGASNRPGAFTLAEIIIVVLLMGILAAVSMPAIAAAGWLGATRAVMAVHALPTLHKGKGMYRLAGQEIRNRLGPDKRRCS